MEVRKFKLCMPNPGEYLFKESVYLDNVIKYINVARIDVSSVKVYNDDCLYICDKFLEDKIDYLIKNRITFGNKFLKITRFEIDAILFYVDSRTLGFCDNTLMTNNTTIDYKTWIVKGLLE